MRRPNNPKTVLAVALAGALALAIPATALISDTDIEQRFVEHEEIRDVSVRDGDIRSSDVRDAAVDGSHVGQASLGDVTIRGTYMNDFSAHDALFEDSRIERASLEDSTLRDVTVCDAAVNGDFHYGACELVDVKDGMETKHARLMKDAPATVAPGGSYDLDVQDAQASSLVVRNEPGGLAGLGFEPDVDPLGLQALGFKAPGDSGIDHFELHHDGEHVASFGLGESVDLPDGDFTLRVHIAEEGVVDHARLGLVLDLDGHGLRPALTTYDVTATALAFAPPEAQLFAPFLADDVARLVITAAVDDAGNVDRDVDIAMSVEVNDVDSEGQELVGDLQAHANLHDDSRLFSEAPFSYNDQVDAAHHPQTLEMLVRAGLVEELGWGAINAYGTHLVAIGPYATNVTLHAETENAHGERLSARSDVQMGATPEEERNVTYFGKEFTMPGRGMLDVSFHADGEPMAAGDDWALSITETPMSHDVRMVLPIDANATSVSQELAGSVLATTPLGNFASSTYDVCVEHDGERDCVEEVAIETGQTTSVDIDLG